jgi:drug/metabolite transporter (DMT)-like permease
MNTTNNEARTRLTGLLNLVIVYIVWGSTYLAIRIGVRPGSGFPPFFLAGTRVLTAGLILLAILAIQRKSIHLTRSEFLRLVFSGVLLWLGGNGLVVFAEQHVDSSVAALIIGSTPLAVTLMESILNQRRPSALLILSMLVGFVGVGLLSAPAFTSGVKADAGYVLLIVLASILWGAGSLFQSRKPVSVAPELSSAVQHLAGAGALLLTAFITREPFPQPTTQALLAWGYLVVFGSLLAFTAYVRALRLLPTNLVMTYAYVNPVIAVILGALILNEKPSAWTLGGMALILLGVAGVFRARAGQKPIH